MVKYSATGDHCYFWPHKSDDPQVRVLELFSQGKDQGIFQSMSKGGSKLHI